MQTSFNLYCKLTTFIKMLALNTFGIFLFSFAVEANANFQGIWNRVNISEPIEVLKQLEPVGFEHRNGVGNVALYLFRYGPINNCYIPGNIFVRENGELTHRFAFYEHDMFKFSTSTQGKIEVLMTPPECLSWVPLVDNAKPEDLPPRHIYQEGCQTGVGPICRVWVEKKQALYPGWWNSRYNHGCWVAYGGNIFIQTKNVEVLTYNNLSEVLPQCKRT